MNDWKNKHTPDWVYSLQGLVCLFLELLNLKPYFHTIPRIPRSWCLCSQCFRGNTRNCKGSLVLAEFCNGTIKWKDWCDFCSDFLIYALYFETVVWKSITTGSKTSTKSEHFIVACQIIYEISTSIISVKCNNLYLKCMLKWWCSEYHTSEKYIIPNFHYSEFSIQQDIYLVKSISSP